MPSPKSSPLISEFILTALKLYSYPENIYPESVDSNVICITLINLNNKEKASETKRMLKDYARLKPRKSSEKGSDRHRFLQALKKSPYVMVLPRSTKDKKFIILKETTAILGGPDAFPSPPESAEELQSDNLVPQSINDGAGFNPLTPELHDEEPTISDPKFDELEENSRPFTFDPWMESFLEDEGLWKELEICQPVVSRAVGELSGGDYQVLQPMDPADFSESV